MDKVEWANNGGVEPSNFGQHHYIFDKDGNGKTLWMKEKVEKTDDGLYKSYIDVSREDYFNEFIKELEIYIEKIGKKQEYDEKISFMYDDGLVINDFTDLFRYLSILIDTYMFNISDFGNSKILLFIDNCDLLSLEQRKELNSLVGYRERQIVYFLGIKSEQKDYIFHTNFSNLTIRSGDDYTVYKVKSILEG